MNRKMRAKVNNQRAKAAKEHARCPRFYDVIQTTAEQAHCDTCGGELVAVSPTIAAVVVELGSAGNETLN